MIQNQKLTRFTFVNYMKNDINLKLLLRLTVYSTYI